MKHFPLRFACSPSILLSPSKTAIFGIPAAFFEIEVTNSTGEPLDYSLGGVLSNPLPANNINHYAQVGGQHLLFLDTNGLPPEDTRYGNLTLATDEADVSVQRYWFKGMWFDNLEVYWREFSAPGRLKDRAYDRAAAGDTTPPCWRRTSACCPANRTGLAL